MKSQKGGDFIDGKQLAEIIDRKLERRMDMSREYSDPELKDLIGACIAELERKIPMISLNRESLLADVFNGRRRMGIIQPYMEDGSVNEIMINGTDGIFIEKNGALLECAERYDSKEALFRSIQSMLSWANRTVNESSPIVDARLSGGARINVVLNPVAINGPIVYAEGIYDGGFHRGRNDFPRRRGLSDARRSRTKKHSGFWRDVIREDNPSESAGRLYSRRQKDYHDRRLGGASSAAQKRRAPGNEKRKYRRKRGN